MARQLQIDEAFLSFAEMIEELSDLDGRAIGAADDELIDMQIARAEIGLPVQLDIVVDEAGHPTIGSVPPLYYVPTSVMPVFHQLSITLTSNRRNHHDQKPSLES